MKLVADEVFGPCAFLEKYRAEDNLDKLNQMNGEEEREDGHGGIAGKNESYGIADAPDVYAVKHEGEHRLSACAEGEVGGVNEAVEGHHCGAYQQELGGKVADAVAGVVNLRNEGRADSQCAAYHGADYNSDEYQLAVLVLCALNVTGAQQMAYDDGDRIGEGENRAEEEVGYGGTDVGGEIASRPRRE